MVDYNFSTLNFYVFQIGKSRANPMSLAQSSITTIGLIQPSNPSNPDCTLAVEYPNSLIISSRHGIQNVTSKDDNIEYEDGIDNYDVSSLMDKRLARIFEMFISNIYSNCLCYSFASRKNSQRKH